MSEDETGRKWAADMAEALDRGSKALLSMAGDLFPDDGTAAAVALAAAFAHACGLSGVPPEDLAEVIRVEHASAKEFFERTVEPERAKERN